MIRSERQSSSCRVGHQYACRSAGHFPKALPTIAIGIAAALATTACGSSRASQLPPSSAAQKSYGSASVSMLGARSLPAQTKEILPAFPAYYDAHKDVVVVSDAFPRPAAAIFHVNYAPSLSALRPASQPAWYIVRGRAAIGQIAVLGSEPGESDYSPLWRTVVVRWKPGAAPQVLTSDNMILSLAKKGELTATKTSMIVNATVVSKR
jgi:hypothetical protein